MVGVRSAGEIIRFGWVLDSWFSLDEVIGHIRLDSVRIGVQGRSRNVLMHIHYFLKFVCLVFISNNVRIKKSSTPVPK